MALAEEFAAPPRPLSVAADVAVAAPPAATLKSPGPASPPVADVTALTEPWPTELVAVTVAVAEPPDPLPPKPWPPPSPPVAFAVSDRRSRRTDCFRSRCWLRRRQLRPWRSRIPRCRRRHRRRRWPLRQAQRPGRRAADGVRERNRDPRYAYKKARRVVGISPRRRSLNNDRASGGLAEDSRTRPAVRQPG